MACYLALDQGTTSSRAILFDDGGRPVLTRTNRWLDLTALAHDLVKRNGPVAVPIHRRQERVRIPDPDPVPDPLGVQRRRRPAGDRPRPQGHRTLPDRRLHDGGQGAPVAAEADGERLHPVVDVYVVAVRLRAGQS